MITYEHLFDVELTTYGPLCPAPDKDASVAGRGPLHLRKPSLYLVSDLFPALSASRRKVFSDVTVETVSQSKTVRFTGERFDQRDLDVLLACVQTAAESGSRSADFGLNEFLRRLGRRVDAARRAGLEQSLRRLEAGRIEISDARYNCRMRLLDRVLIDRAKDRAQVDLDVEALNAFRSAPGLEAFIRERQTLRASPLAQWLAGMLWSLPEDCLAELPRLLVLSGFPTRSPAVFDAEVKDSLELLRRGGLIEKWEQTRPESVVIEKPKRKSDPRRCLLFLK